MDEARKQRLLRNLKSRFRDAKLETSDVPPEKWDDMKQTGLEKLVEASDKLSRLSPERRIMEAAIMLLYPHREAWRTINGYRKEIMEAGAEEQAELLEQVLGVLADNTRMEPKDLIAHIYAFWPVPEQAGAASA